MDSVNPLQPIDLKKKLDSREDIFLLDVREPWEFSLAAIEGSENFPLGEVVDRQQEFVFEEEIVVICHHGERSQTAAQELVESGFKILWSAQTSSRRFTKMKMRLRVFVTALFKQLDRPFVIGCNANAGMETEC